MKTIFSERLKLRAWNEETDLAPLLEFYADESASKFIGGPRKPEVVWRQIAAYIGHAHMRGYGYWAIEAIDTGKLIGAAGLWNSPEWIEMELGYYIFPAFQGNGYATEAARRCQRYAFEELKVDTLISYIDKKNMPSKNVAKKLGGVFDGKRNLAHFGEHEIYRYGGVGGF